MDEQKKIISMTDVQRFLAETFGVTIADVPLGLTFGDLPQWDSLGHMTLMASIEEKFGVMIDADAIAELTDLKSIHAFLERKSNGG